ncbi:MAG: hypothetical protein J1E97_01190 [Muribaculaceae bacterium]|nr:hypothetical protein [Muribaculaceae bacterium]
MEEKRIASSGGYTQEALNDFSDNQMCKVNHFQRNEQIFRVGNDVFEIVNEINAYGQIYQVIQPRTRQSLKERFRGKHIEEWHYYDGFCNMPSHTNYKEIIDNGGKGLYNTYHPIEYKLEKGGEHPTWDKLINHIGGEHAPLLLDYLRILWQKPTQTLPVLCLISKTQHTGKSTFGNALTMLFGENARILSETDLNSEFNPWATGLLAIFEEISTAKKSINKIKNLSTAKRTVINEKHVQHHSVDCFLKILIFSNNEDSFIKANAEDIRYWIIRLPKLKKEDFDPDFDDKLKEEVPYFAWTLQNTKIESKPLSRMWFAPEQIATDALKNIVQNSRSDCAKSLEIWIEETLAEKGNFQATATDICQELRKYSQADISKALKKELNYPEPYKGYYNPIDGSPRKQGRFYSFTSTEEVSEQKKSFLEIPDCDLPF